MELQNQNIQDRSLVEAPLFLKSKEAPLVNSGGAFSFEDT